MPKIIPSLSKKWLKIKNLDFSLFPEIQESLGVLSPKGEKLSRCTCNKYSKLIMQVYISIRRKNR